MFDPLLGGGALLDVGIYPLSLAHMLLGEPDTIDGSARLGVTGVDEESTAILGYADGRQAALTMAVRLDSACDAFILGTEGSVRIPSAWWRSESIVLVVEGRSQKTIDLPCRGNGYTHEAEEFMDLVREHWGLKYPMER